MTPTLPSEPVSRVMSHSNELLGVAVRKDTPFFTMALKRRTQGHLTSVKYSTRPVTTSTSVPAYQTPGILTLTHCRPSPISLSSSEVEEGVLFIQLPAIIAAHVTPGVVHLWDHIWLNTFAEV